MLSGYLPTPHRALEYLRVAGKPVRTTTQSGGRTFVAPRFFETMGVPIVAGREFTDWDTESAPRVVVINQAMARFYFGDENPVGARVGFAGDKGTPFEIVGVAKDFVRGTPRAVAQPEFVTYFPYRDREAINRGAQSRLRVMMSVIRAAGDPRELTTLVRRELRAIDPNLPVIRINTIDEQLGDVLVQERLVATLAGFCGAVAILLATLGLYGVIAYAVARRANEIGVRLALGASRAGVIGMIVREGALLVAAGIAIGLPVTLAATRLVSNRLFGVGAASPSTIVAATLLLMTVGLFAAFLPARRASRVDPMTALRCD